MPSFEDLKKEIAQQDEKHAKEVARTGSRSPISMKSLVFHRFSSFFESFSMVFPQKTLSPLRCLDRIQKEIDELRRRVREAEEMEPRCIGFNDSTDSLVRSVQWTIKNFKQEVPR